MKIYIGFLYLQDDKIEYIDSISFDYTDDKNSLKDLSLGNNNDLCFEISCIGENKIKLFDLNTNALDNLMKILYFLDIHNNHQLNKFQKESKLKIKINSKDLCNDNDGLNLIIPIIFAKLNKDESKNYLENILYMSTNLIGNNESTLIVKPYIDNSTKESLKILEIKQGKENLTCYINASPRGIVYVIEGSDENFKDDYFKNFINSYYRCLQINTYKTIVSNIHLLITLLNRLSDINIQEREINCGFIDEFLKIKNAITHIYKIEHFNSMDGELNNKIFKKLVDEFYNLADICERKLNIMENYLKLKIFKYNLEDI